MRPCKFTQYFGDVQMPCPKAAIGVVEVRKLSADPFRNPVRVSCTEVCDDHAVNAIMAATSQPGFEAKMERFHEYQPGAGSPLCAVPGCTHFKYHPVHGVREASIDDVIFDLLEDQAEREQRAEVGHRLGEDEPTPVAPWAVAPDGTVQMALPSGEEEG